MSLLRFSREELVDLTGYRQPAKQLEELQRRGFHRAKRLVTGEILLERSHYDAVTRGQSRTDIGTGALPRPQLRPPRLRAL